MIRGGLVILASSLAGTHKGAAPMKDAVRAASALELVQAFLLIHDDIMDQDYVRRGKPSLFAQYGRLLAKEPGTHAPEDERRFGEAMGICAGDVSMLLAFELLATLDTDASTRARVLNLCAREIGWVGIAQMNDVYHGFSTHSASEHEILSLYRYKTGRYTFSLPLLLGAILGGMDAADADALSEFGERVGMLFQIRDDDLSVWGKVSLTGKPEGSDIAEDKQTLHRLYLLDTVEESERNAVRSLYGTDDPRNVEKVRTLLEVHGVQTRVRETMDSLATEAKAFVDSLRSVDAAGRELLSQLIRYSAERDA
jgi:geranylgeranyl diphosphate synthase type I